VRDLVARREPLIAFVLRSIAKRYNLDTAEGRIAALRATAPLVARIKDRALKPEYSRTLAGLLGLEVEQVVRTVNQAGRQAPSGRPRRPSGDPEAPAASGGLARPDPDDPVLSVEREALRLAVQCPALAGPLFDATTPEQFTHPVYSAVRRAITEAGGAASGVPETSWVSLLEQHCGGDMIVAATLRELAVESLRSRGEPDPAYVGIVLARVNELTVTRSIVELKSRLQRINPVTDQATYGKLFGELIALEQQKRGLREQSIGAL
ncbi:MAG: DNA primase, partial [Mycobacteriales bacterium]